MKSFYHYLAESSRTYRYRIKSVLPMDKEFLAKVKRALFKYEAELTQPKRTPLQHNPLDFRDFGNVEIYILDIETRVPASSYVLATELRAALQIPDRQLIVRGENEPVEIEARALEEIHKDDQHVAVLDDPTYAREDQPTEVAYGDTYNGKLLDYLSQMRANVEAQDIPAVEEIKKVNKFAWLNKLDDSVGEDFNKDIEGVKPVHVNTKTKGGKAIPPSKARPAGNYDETIKRKG
jgi:hypothetical protein